MNNAVSVAQNGAAMMEQVLIRGDLSRLSPEERTRYYFEVCHSLGLNPATRPLEYITLNGRLILYARRDAADQLRKIHGVSVEVVQRSLEGELFTVHVRAKDKTGRTDEDFGVVAIGKLAGEARANAILKAVTKAKRRVTLSIAGLGFLDETEIEDIPAEARRVNPHVTLPEDIAPPAPSRWRFPPPDGEVKRLAAKDSRDIAETLNHEFHTKETKQDLEVWVKANGNRAARLPERWQETLENRIGEYAERLPEDEDELDPEVKKRLGSIKDQLEQ